MLPDYDNDDEPTYSSQKGETDKPSRRDLAREHLLGKKNTGGAPNRGEIFQSTFGLNGSSWTPKRMLIVLALVIVAAVLLVPKFTGGGASRAIDKAAGSLGADGQAIDARYAGAVDATTLRATLATQQGRVNVRLIGTTRKDLPPRCARRAESYLGKATKAGVLIPSLKLGRKGEGGEWQGLVYIGNAQTSLNESLIARGWVKMKPSDVDTMDSKDAAFLRTADRSARKAKRGLHGKGC